jgi:hypothetical protein
MGFYKAKETLKRVKRKPTELEKTFSKYWLNNMLI